MQGHFRLNGTPGEIKLYLSSLLELYGNIKIKDMLEL